ncbi:hypothetical protein OG884_14875 [Streptosporangium sp. NBC_01755]|uniref:hypothetical protein n=1 Tax=unclassified Streptosporangium TaxID=2632669 RepID=UPI002DD9FB5F|nr:MULTISPECIES: hypothetical protein [unclassified Streptosporangium]WSA25488.1 hypothetical protein OIE13_31995 [Streptosporangium sp. NBC_01810]WSD03123.1 hypothetical protein OG884_14875 [Streptosporangium sp. NBC_01755]
MDPDTFRSDIGADIYWRRRMAALVGVLVVVAVVAWACSSTSRPQDAREAREEGTSAARKDAPDPLLAILPTMTVIPSPPASPTPEPRESKAAPRPRRPGEPCASPQLVLSMEGQGTVYPPGIRPRFILTLVNVGKVMCTTDVGPRTMEVRITSGDDRVWSSSDCVSGETENVRKLDRGIPYVRELVWDRRRSGNDCSVDRTAARPGTYVAVVHAPGLRSRKAVFHLR